MNPSTKRIQSNFPKPQGVSMTNTQQDMSFRDKPRRNTPTAASLAKSHRIPYSHPHFDDDDILLQEILNGASNRCQPKQKRIQESSRPDQSDKNPSSAINRPTMRKQMSATSFFSLHQMPTTTPSSRIIAVASTDERFRLQRQESEPSVIHRRNLMNYEKPCARQESTSVTKQPPHHRQRRLRHEETDIIPNEKEIHAQKYSKQSNSSKRREPILRLKKSERDSQGRTSHSRHGGVTVKDTRRQRPTTETITMNSSIGTISKHEESHKALHPQATSQPGINPVSDTGSFQHTLILKQKRDKSKKVRHSLHSNATNSEMICNQKSPTSTRHDIRAKDSRKPQKNVSIIVSCRQKPTEQMQHNRQEIFLALGNDNHQRAPFQDEGKSACTLMCGNGTSDVQNLNTHTEDMHRNETFGRIFTNKHEAILVNSSEKHTRHRGSTNPVMVLPKHLVVTANEKSEAQGSEKALSWCTTKHNLDEHGALAKRLSQGWAGVIKQTKNMIRFKQSSLKQNPSAATEEFSTLSTSRDTVSIAVLDNLAAISVMTNQLNIAVPPDKPDIQQRIAISLKKSAELRDPVEEWPLSRIPGMFEWDNLPVEHITEYSSSVEPWSMRHVSLSSKVINDSLCTNIYRSTVCNKGVNVFPDPLCKVNETGTRVVPRPQAREKSSVGSPIVGSSIHARNDGLQMNQVSRDFLENSLDTAITTSMALQVKDESVTPNERLEKQKITLMKLQQFSVLEPLKEVCSNTTSTTLSMPTESTLIIASIPKETKSRVQNLKQNHVCHIPYPVNEVCCTDADSDVSSLDSRGPSIMHGWSRPSRFLDKSTTRTVVMYRLFPPCQADSPDPAADSPTSFQEECCNFSIVDGLLDPRSVSMIEEKVKRVLENEYHRNVFRHAQKCILVKSRVLTTFEIKKAASIYSVAANHKRKGHPTCTTFCTSKIQEA